MSYRYGQEPDPAVVKVNRWSTRVLLVCFVLLLVAVWLPDDDLAGRVGVTAALFGVPSGMLALLSFLVRYDP